jgi:signal transduction histidine kinase/AmiR/NasT family two-component response regulator
MKSYPELPLRWPRSLRFALGLALFLLGLAARFAIAPQHGGLAFVTFYPAILLCFYLAGTGPGVLTAVLSGLAGQYFFIAPYRTFPVDPGSYRSLAVFALTASLMAWIISRLHGYAHSLRVALERYQEAQQELAKYRDHLEDLVALRTQELTEARTAAEAANIAKSAFLANMSHEIRTPMNGVLGMANLVRRAGVTSEQQEYLDKIETSGRYLLGIVDDILDLSKIEAGKLQLSPRDFALDELLRDITAVVGDRAAAKGLALRVDMPNAPRWLHGDSARLTQALVNYLGNAVKFTEQGSVALSCRVLDEDDTGYLLRFEVTDTGIGMTRDEQIRIFEPFEQVDKTARRRFHGSGLGLAIAKRIAALMGGTVGVESEPGKGSSFWLTVQLNRGAPRPIAPEAPPKEAAEVLLARDFNGTRVLLAEDDPVSREVAQYLLQSVGLAVEVAENGAEAVEMATCSDFALILTDMQMPKMDGLQATAAIRALPGRQSTPVLALTANAFAEDRRRCLEAGMNDFIVKPFEPKHLFETVLKWLSERPSERFLEQGARSSPDASG